MTEAGPALVVRTAVVADAPAVAAIGRVAFPAVHNDVVGPEFAAALVEQTYSIEALTDCITRCTAAFDAEFLVAELDDEVIGFLHYDSEGPEPELHRIYVDPGRKRGGVGSALMRELHRRLPHGKAYVLFVAEANTDAQGFYQRHGLVVERRVEGGSHLAIGVNVDGPPPAPALVMRYPASTTDARPDGRAGQGQNPPSPAGF
jgi:ribosomal protein S18 acetylase RimI-like enzyme